MLSLCLSLRGKVRCTKIEPQTCLSGRQGHQVTKFHTCVPKHYGAQALRKNIEIRFMRNISFVIIPCLIYRADRPHFFTEYIIRQCLFRFFKCFYIRLNCDFFIAFNYNVFSLNGSPACCKVETFRALFKNAIQLLLTETISQDTFEMSCALLTFYPGKG